MRTFCLDNREHLTPVLMGMSNSHRWSFLVNPRGLRWAKYPAYAYDLYHPESLRLEYVPRCPTTTVGRIVMFIDYDPADDNSNLTFDDIANMSGAVTDSLYKSLSVSYRSASTVLAQHKYFCSDSVTPDRLAHCCRLWVCVEGGDSTKEELCGDLYLHYRFTLSNPEMPTTMLPDTLRIALKPNGVPDGTSTSPFGTLSQNVATATNLASTVAQVKNITDTVTATLSGLYDGAVSYKTADMDLANHPIMSSYNDTGALITHSTYDALWPVNKFVVFKTEATSILVTFQLVYNYVPSSASDIPSFAYAYNDADWSLTPNGAEYNNNLMSGVPAAKVGVSTSVVQLVVMHFTRKSPCRGFVFQIQITGTSAAGISNAKVADLMLCPYPTDVVTPLY